MRLIPTSWFLALTTLFLGMQSVMGAPSADPSLVYYLPFDGSTKATVNIGGQVDPVLARAVKFVPGIVGQAVYVGGYGDQNYATAPLLEYDAGKLFASPTGTVSFWIRPDWDGHFENPQNFPWYFLLTVMGGKETPDFDSVDVQNGNYDRFSLFMWNWLRGDLPQKSGKTAMLEWQCRPVWMKNDWWHVAFTWSDKNKVQLFVNGLPRTGNAEHMFADSQRFFIGGCGRTRVGSFRANAAFDEFKIFNRALNGQEIQSEFRSLAPVDFSVNRRYLRANTSEQVVLDVEPGLGGAAGPGAVAGELQLRVIADVDGKTVAQYKTNLKLSGRESITMPVDALPTGNYRLECIFQSENSCYQRSYALTVYQQDSMPLVSKEPVKLGDRIVSIDCTKNGEGFYESGPSHIRNVTDVGSYREVGSSKMDRCSYEITIPNADGSPVMMEITWPDDRERSMGLYMIPQADSPQHRDRLSGGIQSGGEYPVTRTMQKASYLFYPGENKYLFEARTMVTGLPAAVAKVEIFRLADRLPKLPIASPDGLPGRLVGHLDEDQTFDVLMAPRGDSRFPKSPLCSGYPIQALERLMDYFDYTGQNVLSYAMVRYGWTHYDEGPINNYKGSSALFPPGGELLMLDMLQQRNQHLIGNINLYTVPIKPTLCFQETPEEAQKRVQEGYFLFDRNGKPRPAAPEHAGGMGLGNNPLHPVVRARLLEIVSEILRRYGKHPAFDGLDIWCCRSSPFIFNSLDYGYDDLTVGMFEKETGIMVPNITKTTARFNSRYQYLTGEKRVQWTRWRSQKTTALFREIDQMVRATRPDLQLYLSPGGWTDSSPGNLAKSRCDQFDFSVFTREQLSLDIDALSELPSVVLNPQPNITEYRWIKWWYGRESVWRELNADIQKFQVFRKGKKNALSLYLTYFESFNGSQKQDVYKSYFQNADVKAHGRFFLEDMARGMAAVDPSVLTIGAQPLGSSGRDIETREFAQAFRALPAGAYEDVAGLKDPVTVRQLQTPKGTYFYAVNLIWMPVSVAVKCDNEKTTITDLSSGQTLNVNGGEVTVALKPFEMRSMLAVGKTNVTGRMIIPPETSRWYSQQVKKIEDDIQAIAKNGGGVELQKERLTTIKTLLGHHAYAEVHRLLFSKMFRDLSKDQEYSAAGYYKDMKAMLARSEYAIACGSTKFYRAKTGQLFLPDNQYEAGGYGYEGNYLSIERSVTGLKGSDDPALFATEAYNLDAYRFTVKNGKYTVRMHFKVGYEPGAKPGVFVFNVDIENKRVLSNFDVFEAASREFGRAAVREFKNVEVKDGVLDIEFSLLPGNTDSSVKMCNAIEVIPQ